jgi:hypothetical protein
MSEEQDQKRSCEYKFRLTPAELSKIKMLAKMYASGNTSQWIVYACLNAQRKYLPKKKGTAA